MNDHFAFISNPTAFLSHAIFDLFSAFVGFSQMPARIVHFGMDKRDKSVIGLTVSTERRKPRP
ncbi:hypothetical protein NECAME_10720 [Necator americanus]|uniref:Uncharacterized protein n=1 Tax=Necator americanus TaxID=51031 RepID=W2T7C3_NECAM|nr:hypothetical protein NECAME_10720 [Necator americanus]ETN77915.1 hypothetical protein NECAME_10720 [Necator americanus]